MPGKLLKIFYPSSVLHNSPPVNEAIKDTVLFKDNALIRFPQSGLFLLKRVFVTDLGIIYKYFFSLKENIICYNSDFKNYRFRYLLKSFLTFKKQSCSAGKYLIIFDNYSGPNGFAHWVSDGLTRLAEMNDSLEEYTLVVPAYFKGDNFYAESLKLFKVSAIHYLPQNSITFFKELYYPTHIGETGNFHPDNVQKLRNIVDAKVPADATTPKNIYISRGKAKKRFVLNENEVVTALGAYHFETIFLEDYGFAEQIRIIKNAGNIVSIHGAALSMILFANTGANIMELRSDKDAVNNMYYLLASVCHLNYYYVGCVQNKKPGAGNDFDLLVPIPELEKQVEQMLKTTR
ncbi:MAG: glycosyltransferase family 61 protein [Bacteroidota bacterium]